MTSKITLITPPDDIGTDGSRILIYDLTTNQSQLVSTCLGKINSANQIILYVANGKDDTKWIVDKKQKCSIILYNAESQNQTMVGYLTAQSNSYYFGELKTLSSVNNNKIISKEQIEMIMEDQYKKYAKL